MKILFVTDLHGAEWKYERLYDIARADRPDAVINSGDMLPKGDNLFRQRDFITQELDRHFARFDALGMPYFCYLGNDDLRIWDDLFEATCQKYPCVQNIAQRKVTYLGFEFIGMNWVTDYPFRLKDRCRMDSGDYAFQPQFGTGLLSTPAGWEEIVDWRGYAAGLPTIADELKALAFPDQMSRSVYVFHMPPGDLGLDVCLNGRTVGSKAIRQPTQNLLPRAHPRVAGDERCVESAPGRHPLRPARSTRRRIHLCDRRPLVHGRRAPV